jgi:hypothetical protein
MTSADFYFVTRHVTMSGAMKLLLLVLPVVRISSPSTAAGDAWTLITRYGPSRDLLQKLLNACKADLPG